MSKSKSNKKGKKANKSKTKKSPFRILDLPTELIENICEILVEQNRQKSLAALNAANKFLREVTTPYLWEKVRWTKQTWKPEVYLAKGVPEMFAHIRAITLVSSDQDEYNGWGAFDSLFWSPLITAGMNVSPDSTFGQLAHLFFPKVQFVISLAGAPTKARQRKTTNACAYVSDQNLVEQHDTETFRRMIFDTVLWEARRGKDVPQGFADAAIMALPLQLEVSGLIPRGIGKAVPRLRATFAALTVSTSADLVVGDSVPFRVLMTIPLVGVDIHMHLLTTTSSEAMENRLRGKVFDLMEIVKRLVAEDRGHCIFDHLLKVTLGRDLRFNMLPSGASFFDYCEKWLIDLSLNPLPPVADHSVDAKFKLTVNMPEEFTWERLFERALALHNVLAGLHANSPQGIHPNLPISLVVNGFFHEAFVTERAMCARMGFAPKELSTVVFFGQYLVKEAYCVLETYYDNGKEVVDQKHRDRLNALFQSVQPETRSVTGYGVGPLRGIGAII